MMLRRILMGVLVLLAVLVAAAVPAGACPCQFTVEKIEIGAGAPGGTYTIRVTGPGGTFDVQVTAGQTTTVGELPAGDYTFTEVEAPPGATVEPSQVDIPQRVRACGGHESVPGRPAEHPEGRDR